MKDIEFLDWLAPYIPKGVISVLLPVLAGLLLIRIFIAAFRTTWEVTGAPIISAFLSEQKRREIAERKTYARWVVNQLRLVSALEDFRDDNYTELEAEVEVEHRPKITFGVGRSGGVRRESSLSRALRRNRDDFVVLEGDPGSGKSVALRHVAQVMAERYGWLGRGSRSLPIYVNLKELAPAYPITYSGLREFVLDSVSASATVDIADIVEGRFDEYMRTGRWYFLFDSFDEIPRVMGATEDDPVIEQYAITIHNWLASSRCSAVVASRRFRGPRRLAGSRFKIVGLSAARQRLLVRRAYLGARQDVTLDGLVKPPPSIADLTSNPLWLGLLISHMRAGGDFPSHSYQVFETYMNRRIVQSTTRRRQGGKQKKGTNAQTLRQRAEDIAYCLTADDDLGLVATPEAITAALDKQELNSSGVDSLLQELRTLKVMRSALLTSGEEVTFAHRRLQEYLATCYLLRNPESANSIDLLTDGRWREIAVAIMHTQPPAHVARLLEGLDARLNAFAGEGDKDINPTPDAKFGDRLAGAPFEWPTGSRHLLTLLSAGLLAGTSNIAAPARKAAGDLLLTAARQGGPIDRKWAVDCAAVADTESQVWLVEQAFASQGDYLRDAAYAQAARLPMRTRKIDRAIRQTLMGLTAGGQLRRTRHTVLAEVRRLRDPELFVSTIKLLVALPFVDLLLLFSPWLVLAATGATRRTAAMTTSTIVLGATAATLFAHLTIYLLRATPPIANASSRGLAASLRRLSRGIFGGSYEAVLIMSTEVAISASLVFYAGVLINFATPRAFLIVIIGPCYVCLWPLFAFWSAHTGKLTGMGWWPVLPLYWVCSSLISIPVLVRRLLHRDTRALIVGAAAAALLLYLFASTSSRWITTPVSVGVSLASGALVLSSLVVVCARVFVHRMIDRQCRREWFRRNQSSVSAGELLLAVRQLRSKYGAFRLMSDVRRTRNLSDDAIEVMLDLVTAVDFQRYVQISTGSISALLDTPRRLDGLRAKIRPDARRDEGRRYWPEWRSERFGEWFRLYWSQYPGRLGRLLDGECLDEMLRATESALTQDS
jgi:energy-coupling factor transporter ATP-binding protein EcfA2